MSEWLFIYLLEAKSRGMQKSRKRKQGKETNTEVNGQEEIKMVSWNSSSCHLHKINNYNI